MATGRIRVIALCVFRHGDKILVCEHFDAIKGTPYYRPIGGTVEFGEKAEDTIRREIMEEIGLEIADIVLLDILENIFTAGGAVGHEIVYMFDARFTDSSNYTRESIAVVEPNGLTLNAAWRSLDFFTDYYRLVPDALLPLLKTGKA